MKILHLITETNSKDTKEIIPNNAAINQSGEELGNDEDVTFMDDVKNGNTKYKIDFDQKKDK